MEHEVDRNSSLHVVGLLVACAWACAGPEAAATKPEAGRTKGPVVAKVNGEPITLSEVEELVRTTGLTPITALRRLEEEQLLAAYAVQRGYGAKGRELKQARVRALLRVAVEARTAPVDMAPTEVLARFEVVKARNPTMTLVFAEHEANLRTQLSNEKRKASLAQLIETLKARDPVQFNEAMAQKALADDSLLGARP